MKVRLRPLLLLVPTLIFLSMGLSEFSLRLLHSFLPLPYLVYLSNSIKDQHPSIIKTIKTKYPNLYSFREVSASNWTMLPNHFLEGVDEDGAQFSILTNDLGFISSTAPAGAEQNEQLLIIGDSFLSTFHQPLIATKLQENLQVSVVNLSCPVWGPANYLDAFLEYGRDKKTKKVVVFSFENDINDAFHFDSWMRSNSRLSFLQYQATRFWMPSLNSFTESVNTGEGFLNEKSFLWNLFKFFSNRLAQLGKAQAKDLHWSKPEDFLKHLEPGAIFLNNDPKNFLPDGSMEYWVRPYFQQMEVLIDQIRESGKEPILIWIPSRESVYFPLLPEEKKRSLSRVAVGAHGIYSLALERFVNAKNITYLDLTSELQKRALGRTGLYYKNDFHMNADGAAALAEIVTSFLKKEI